MQISLHLPNTKPLNLNHCYTISTIGGKVRRFPSPEYKKYESLVNLELRKYKSEINKFNNYYDENKHYIVAEYRFYYPIITKKETLSKRSTDLSNAIKALEDIIFKSLIADDSQIAELNVTKIHSENVRAEITFTIKDLKHIK